MKRFKISICLVIAFLLLAGCPGFFNSNPKAQYVVSSQVFASVVNTLAAYRNDGKFSDNEVMIITVTVHEGQALLLSWEQFINSGQQVSPDLLKSFNRILQVLIDYEKKVGVK